MQRIKNIPFTYKVVAVLFIINLLSFSFSFSYFTTKDTTTSSIENTEDKNQMQVDNKYVILMSQAFKLFNTLKN